jgi:hypothetical protein
MAALPMVLMAAGGAMGAIGSISQGYQQKKIADANAQLAEQDAVNKREAGKADTMRISEERRQLVGTQTAMLGASGLDPSQGSPLEIMLDTQRKSDRDMMYRGYQADVGATNSMNQAEIYRTQGKNAVTSGWLGAGASLLGSAGSFFSSSSGQGAMKKWGWT